MRIQILILQFKGLRSYTRKWAKIRPPFHHFALPWKTVLYHHQQMNPGPRCSKGG